MPPPVNLQGKTFGRLAFVSRVPGTRTAIFKCVCGNERTLFVSNVTTGKTQSCGCLHSEVTRERNTTHGNAERGKHSPEYMVWANMIARCTRPSRSDYQRYGGRGIKVCPRWLEFAKFLADMGKRPAGKTLERKDNSGHYEPDNCRWATPTEQANNRRSNVLIEFQGKRQDIKAWSIETGLSQAAIESRIKRGATDPAQILRR